MKRIIVLLLTFLLVFPAMAFAAEGTADQWGENLACQLVANADGTYTLTISGTGAMADSAVGAKPWAVQSAKISKVVVSEGVTSIAAGAFADLSNLKTVDMAQSVDSIAADAFPNVTFEMLGWLNHSSGAYAQAHANVQLQLKELRILSIGNSHTDDYTAHFGTMFSDLAKVMDTKITHQNLIYGGRRLIVDEGSTRSHYIAAKDPSVAGHGEYASAFAKTWDLVLMQDYRESVQFGAEFADELQTAVKWIREEVPGAQIGWIADWAEPTSGYQHATGVAAIQAVQTLADGKPDFIVPLGTIVDNARSSYFGTTMNAKGVWSGYAHTHSFTILDRDANHLSLELGRYTAGVGILYHLTQRFKDVLIADEFDLFDVLTTDPVYPDWQGEFVDDYRLVIEEAAINAYNTPLAITQSQYTKDPFDVIYEKMTPILEVNLPWSVVKERLGGTVVTSDIIAQLSAATGWDIQPEDITVGIKSGIYSVTVNASYGYATTSKPAMTGGVSGVSDGSYYVDGVPTAAGLIYDADEGCYYYARTGGKIQTGEYTVYAAKTNGLLPAGTYDFGPDGKLFIKTEEPDEPETPGVPVEPDVPVDPETPVEPEKNGFVYEDGAYYYYVDDVRTYAGLIYDETEGCYYYVRSNYKMATGTYQVYAAKANGLLPAGTYDFGADGKLFIKEEEPDGTKNGFVYENGAYYYYVDGALTYAGLVYDEAEGCYYYVRSNYKMATGTYQVYAAKTNGLLPAGVYDFGADGKLFIKQENPDEPKNGFLYENGAYYYYVDGVLTYAGLVYDETEGCYYYVRSNYKMATGTYQVYAAKTNGLLPAGVYDFGADGKLFVEGEKPSKPSQPETPAEPVIKNGFVYENGGYYYYVDGELTYAGLIYDETEGCYYYVRSNFKKATGEYQVYAAKTNGLLPAGTYNFGADGKLFVD